MQLPIYPSPEPIVTLVETPHPISPYIAQAREATTETLGGARGYVEEGVSRWIGFERRVEREYIGQGDQILAKPRLTRSLQARSRASSPETKP